MRAFMPIRIGIVGAGVIGRLRAQSVRASTATKLLAVADPDGAAAKRLAGGDAVAVTELDRLWDQPLDAVIVSSPVQYHAEACVAALSRGLHVLVEKPLTNSLESAESVVAAARQAGRVLAVGFNLRYFPSMAYIRRVIDDGTIGDLIHVRLFGGHDGLANFRADWQYRAPESGGGATMDIGIHLSDLARFYLGDITEVYGVASERVWQVEGSEDDAIAVLRNPAGVPARYHATWDEWEGYRLVVEAYGTLGMVRGSYGPMRNLLITHERPGAPRRTVKKWYPEVMLREKFRSWETTTEMSFEDELRDFVARIQGQPGGWLADGHDGLRSMQVAAAVRQSSASREAVHLPPLGPLNG
jgi:predicted dehydrogenase